MENAIGIYRDRPRLLRVLPTGERVTDYEWKMIVEPEIRRRRNTMNAPPIATWFLTPSTGEQLEREIERIRRDPEIKAARAAEVRREIERIEAGWFTIVGGFRLMPEPYQIAEDQP